MGNLLEVNHLSVQYVSDLETVYAVNNISFSLAPGRVLGIVGETGAGKTTTALSIMGLLPGRTGRISEGSIRFDGEELTTMPESKKESIRGRRIAMVFQDPMTALNPVFTVCQQISEAIAIHHPDLGKDAIIRKVEDTLRLVGIPGDRMHDYPHQFSGGMKQRVVIAIALACSPELLIADEPTTALDVTIQAQILRMIAALKTTLNMSMILITHDLGIIVQMCDDVAVMYAGEFIEMGSVEDIFSGTIRHPYTCGLFGSIPNLSIKTSRLAPIPGLMPDPTVVHKGCPFSDRCPKKVTDCELRKPPVVHKGTHAVRCVLFGGGHSPMEE